MACGACSKSAVLVIRSGSNSTSVPTKPAQVLRPRKVLTAPRIIQKAVDKHRVQ